MSEIIKLITPLTKECVKNLKAGDQVLISGTIYTARDIAHQRLCQTINDSLELPFDLNGAIIYFVGPSPARDGRAIGAAGPTTSSRMDAFSPTLLDNGLSGMIGKGYRFSEVRESLKKNDAVHFSAIGGAGALLSKAITASKIIAYNDLGTEAIRELQVKDFPAVVAYDCHGKSVYGEK